MEHIDEQSGDEVMDRILFSDSVSSLKNCLESYTHVFAVMDSNVALLCPAAAQIAEVLNARKVPGMLIEVSEAVKTMDTVMEICSWLLRQGADRDALVLAAGGGITLDIVGFAASIYKRGVSFAYVPTTLLSQVDASIGGKNGVNLDGYKNMIGTIRQPEFTLICPEMLISLPKRDFLSGAAEMLKAFIIKDEGHYDSAVSFLSGYRESGFAADYLHDNLENLKSLIAASVRVKAEIVSRDMYESGERRVLNLGHTFAHAVESLALERSMDITHGEAVAMGLIMAAGLAELRSITDPEAGDAFGRCLCRKLEEDFVRCGLPVACPFDIRDMAGIMLRDKKSHDGKIRFVLPCDIGNIVMPDLTADEVVGLLS